MIPGRSNSLIWFATRFGGVGTLVSLALFAILMVLNRENVWGHSRALVEKMILMFWPTGLLMQSPKSDVFLLCISVISNAALYFILGTMFWYGIAKHKAFIAIPLILIAAFWCWAIRLAYW